MTDSAPVKLSNTQLRKIKKPLIERRRRERINECLNQLKDLIFEATNTQESRYTKLEKADILEMTVQHLRQKQQQLQHRRAASPTSSADASSNAEDAMLATVRFRTGYLACVREVQRCLGILPLDNKQQSRLCDHLSGCLNRLQSSPSPADVIAAALHHQQQQQHESVLPLHQRRGASLSSSVSSSSSSVTSSPPSSPTNRNSPPLSRDFSVSSSASMHAALDMSAAGARGTSTSDVFTVGLLPNSVPVVLRKLAQQWPEGVAPVSASRSSDILLHHQQQQQHIACSPLYLTQSQQHRVISDAPEKLRSNAYPALYVDTASLLAQQRARYSPTAADVAPRASHRSTVVDNEDADSNDIPVLSPKLLPCAAPIHCDSIDGPMWRPW